MVEITSLKQSLMERGCSCIRKDKNTHFSPAGKATTGILVLLY